MAPWPRAFNDPDVSMLPVAPAFENLSASPAPDYRIPNGLTDHQFNVIESTSLAVAALSFASVTIAFYWFSRMRRSFRHDLIMLLMSSDMLKSLSFIIFPIVDFRNGPIPSESSFCQASGFFLTVGIEASDISVVLIALHTALYILRPRQSGRQNGLYPHRRIALGVFLFIPLLMASLAFINRPGYANNGEYCYLPIRPDWMRLALSWVPRYVILFIIVALYAYIYTYVTLRIRRFGRLSAMRRASATQMPNDGYWARIPSVNPHMQMSRRGSDTSIEESERQRTPPGATSMTANIELVHGRQQIQWNWPTHGNDTNGRIPEQEERTEPCNTFGPNTSPRAATFEPISPPPQSHFRRDTFDSDSSYFRSHRQPSYSSPWPSPHSPTTARAKSLANIWSILRRGTSLDSETDQNTTPFLFHPTVDGTGMAQTRDKIRRQLRLLFVYPIVYILIWAVPFVSHVIRWNRPDQTGPFAVVLLSLISLSVQGLVNACLFCAMEKPWGGRKAKDRRSPSKLRRDKEVARNRLGLQRT